MTWFLLLASARERLLRLAWWKRATTALSPRLDPVCDDGPMKSTRIAPLMDPPRSWQCVQYEDGVYALYEPEQAWDLFYRGIVALRGVYHHRGDFYQWAAMRSAYCNSFNQRSGHPLHHRVNGWESIDVLVGRATYEGES